MRWTPLVLVLLVGCSSAPAPDAMFTGATHRFSDSVLEGFDNRTQLELGEGPHTIFASVKAEGSFGVYLIEPDRREPYSGMYLTGPHHGFTQFGTVEIQELRYTTFGGPAGTWTLAWGCLDACTFTVAVEEGVHIPERPIGRTPAYASVMGVVHDGAETFDFRVPRADGDLTFVTDIYGTGGVRYHMTDNSGDAVSSWRWNDIYARGWRHTADIEATAGDWNLDVTCGSCRFHIGVA